MSATGGLLGPLLMVVGAGAVFLGIAGERAHSARMSAHMTRLEEAGKREDEAAMQEAYQRFQEDRWLDLAVDAMLLQPIGFVVFGAGLLLWLV